MKLIGTLKEILAYLNLYHLQKSCIDVGEILGHSFFVTDRLSGLVGLHVSARDNVDQKIKHFTACYGDLNISLLNLRNEIEVSVSA